jgi:hypothetical protein
VTAVNADGRQPAAAGRSLAWPPSGFVVGLVLVAAYALIRTLALPDPVLLAWTGAAVAATLIAPAAGLTVLAAIGPFTEALTDDGRVTAAPILMATLGAALVLHILITRRLPRPSLPLALALALLVGTALGVANSFRLGGPDAGMEAARLWVPGIGGGLTVLLAAAWSAWRLEIRPVLIVMASVALAGVVSVADLVSDGQIRGGPVGWLLRSDTVMERLGGIIPAPNAAAAILLVALAVCLAALFFARRPEFRLMAAVALAPLATALVLTYSRSALLGLAAVAGLLAWRFRRAAGIAVLSVALIGAVAAMSGYLTFRDDAQSPGAPGVPQTRGDEQRLAAWGASVRMWADEPVVGHGFRSFEWLHEEYGAGPIDAPHNEWLRFFAEEGTFIGLAGVAFALSSIYVLMRSPGWITAGSAAAGAGVFVMASFNNPFLYSQVNVPAFLVLGTGLGLALRAPPPSPDAPAPSEYP